MNAKHMLAAVAILITTGATFAQSTYRPEEFGVAKTIELKDGLTVYVFNNGKMGMEDKYGHILSMKEGHTMETKDGQKILMNGNETARTDNLLHALYGYGA